MKGSAVATLMTGCFRGIGNCGITIVSYSRPRCGLTSLQSRRLRLVGDDSCFGTRTYRRFGGLNGGSFDMAEDGTIGTLSSTRAILGRARIGLSFVFFSVPKAVGDRNIVGALSRVSCVFMPIDTSHFIMRDTVDFVRLFRSGFLARN